MHWLPKDVPTWGFVLSVLALVLMYPVGILTNITTPKLQNWWAERSRTALIKRIDKLHEELRGRSVLLERSESEDEIIKGIYRVTKLVVLGFTYTLLTLLLMSNTVGPRITCSLGLLGFFAVNIFLDQIDKLQQKYSPSRRRELEHSIETLRSKLENHE
jgi:hypothetical protein